MQLRRQYFTSPSCSAAGGSYNYIRGPVRATAIRSQPPLAAGARCRFGALARLRGVEGRSLSAVGLRNTGCRCRHFFCCVRRCYFPPFLVCCVFRRGFAAVAVAAAVPCRAAERSRCGRSPNSPNFSIVFPVFPLGGSGGLVGCRAEG